MLTVYFLSLPPHLSDDIGESYKYGVLNSVGVTQFSDGTVVLTSSSASFFTSSFFNIS
jgi:hypothetical protein